MARSGGVSRWQLLLCVGGVVTTISTAVATPAASEARVRLVSSASGTEGVREGNRYRISEPKTTFTVPEDHQVTVAFEWEGAPGDVRFEGRWKDPTGQVVLVSPIDYEIVKPRFDLYWSLGLPETLAPGLWALEVWVEGQRVASHSFEVRVPIPERMTAADVYREAMDAVATVTSQGPRGEPIGQGIAIALDEDHLLTSFSTIEGATGLKVQMPDGRSVETDAVRGWSRPEDWAVLRATAHGLKELPRPADPELTIGSQVFVLGSVDDGSRIIAEPQVVGLRRLSTGREALRLSEGAACGSPILDDGSRLVGVVIGDTSPRLGPMATRIGLEGLVGVPGLRFGDSVLPIAAVGEVAATGVSSLAELAAAGHFPRPISPASRHVISGVFALRVGKQGDVPMPLHQSFVFSRSEGSVSVFVQWDPAEKLDAASTFEIFDSENRSLGKSKPTKLKLRPNKRFFSVWTFQTERLRPAVYRVDSLLDGDVVWRGHVQITD